MNTLTILFLKIAKMSLTAGLVILIILPVRWLLRRFPKSLSYMLWLVAAFRLVVPVSVDSGISIFNLSMKAGDSVLLISEESARNKVDENVAGQTQTDMELTVADKGFLGNVDMFHPKNVPDISIRQGMDRTAKNDFGWMDLSALIWVSGVVIAVLYIVFEQVKIRTKIRYGIRLYDNVYECDNIRSPFVFGLFLPKIYIPFRLNGVQRQCVLMHENYHIHRKDHLIKSFAYALLIIYWFQPLVWIAFYLMCIDMEMSCDEKIIAKLNTDMRKEYSRLLLSFASNKRQVPVSPLAFGEENTMKRIRNILQYKKPALWRITVGAAVIMITAAACGTDAATDEAIAPIPDTNMEMGDSLADLDLAGLDSENNITLNFPEELDHQEAQWAKNSMFDYELCTLDYADRDLIIFHISSGLFQYDLKKQKIMGSLDMKALNCQEVQTGGECRIKIYQDKKNGLRAVIAPYPYSDESSYVYDFATDTLFLYDNELLNSYTMFDGFVSKWDLEEQKLRTGRISENVLPLGDNTYGILHFGDARLSTMRYTEGDKDWILFRDDQATLPEQIRQDDSFYESVTLNSTKEIGQCILDYEAFYRMHDYAGICALSEGLEYSDEMQQNFGKDTGTLSYGVEISSSEDKKEYLFQFMYSDDSREVQEKVYISFHYLEGKGWRADGLPKYSPKGLTAMDSY